MEAELRESEAEANEVIGQWQANCTESELKCARIKKELNDLKEAKQTEGGSLAESVLNEAEYKKMVDTVVQKTEELRQLSEEAESSKSSLKKLEGM